VLKELMLPRAGGGLSAYTPSGEPLPVTPADPPKSRVAYAAAHIVADPLADVNPTLEAAVDWEATLAYRRLLWSLGLSVAEAMDTAQRGMGLDWESTKELILRCVAEARAESAEDLVASGAGTDHLPPSPDVKLDDVARAYEEQISFVEGEGSRVILMASRALAAVARGPEDYAEVYGRVLSQATRPVILHWLGEVFDPALAAYWGSGDLGEAMEACLSVIREHADKVDGIKISLLEARYEVEMRRLLPEGVRMYTGDDFNYPELILGDEGGHSDALLGIFDAIAPAASAALHALDGGDEARYE